MANKSEIAKFFEVVLAKMAKIVMYVTVIKRSIANQATTHYHLYSQLATRLLATTKQINKEAFYVSFEQ